MHTEPYMPGHRISQIAAIDRARGLGNSGDLIYKIPDDLKRFREMTSGHPVIMGRKTWESLPDAVRPMPGRTNIVVTRQADYPADGASVATSVEAALAMVEAAPGSQEIYVIGGGDLYTAALPYTDRLYLTLVDDERPADTFFPDYSAFTRVIQDESHEQDGIRFRYLTLEK